jgi:serine/threonine protein kinase
MNLMHALRQKELQLDIHTKLRIAIDIAEAMEFLHSKNIVHRNLKSANILLSRNAAKVYFHFPSSSQLQRLYVSSMPCKVWSQPPA